MPPAFDRPMRELFDPEKTPGFDGETLKGNEATLLYGLVTCTRPQIVCETGTHKGISTTVLALAALTANPGAYVHTWDTVDHGCYELWHEWGVGDKISFHHRPSVDIMGAVGHCDFLFIDADHSRRYVEEEWDAWKYKLSVGATIVFHDSRSVPVLTVARSLFLRREIVLLNFPSPNGIAVGQWRPYDLWVRDRGEVDEPGMRDARGMRRYWGDEIGPPPAPDP